MHQNYGVTVKTVTLFLPFLTFEIKSNLSDMKTTYLFLDLWVYRYLYL